MKKIVLVALVLIGVAIVGVGAAGAMQPDHIHVERSIVVNATPADLAPFAEDLEKVNEWSPWEGLDPKLEKTFSEQTNVVGASYAWKGNEDVGQGVQTIKSIEPGKVVHALEFIEPFAGKADSTIAYAREGDDLKVTWMYDSDADFMTKVMTVFMNMDEMLGPDYEKGLGMLKPVVEKAATERRAAEKKAEKEAAAKAEAEAEAEAEPTAEAAAE